MLYVMLPCYVIYLSLKDLNTHVCILSLPQAHMVLFFRSTGLEIKASPMMRSSLLAFVPGYLIQDELTSQLNNQ